MKKIIPLLFLFSSAVFAQQSYIPFAKTLDKKGYQFSLSGNYWQSSERIDYNGEKSDFPDGQSFKRIESEVNAQYGIARNFQVGGGFRYRNNQAKIDDGAGQIMDASSAGPESIFLNTIYLFEPYGRITYGLDGSYRYRPYTEDTVDVNNFNREKIILGELGNEYNLGILATYSSPSKNYLSFRTGFRDPGTDVSNEIYYQGEIALTWKYFAVVGGLDGIFSVKDDAYANDPQNKPLYNRGNSELYNGINRDYVAPYAGVNIALGKNWRAEFRGSQVMSGTSTDTGTQFGLTIAYRKETPPELIVDAKFKTYDLEAAVTKVSEKKNFVEIDKGLSSDIYKGMRVDLFEFDYLGGNVLVARGVVMQVKVDSAVVKISSRFNPAKEIKQGLIARMTLK